MRQGFTSNTLIVFARAPELGRVKTRLAAEIGPAAALAAYRTLAERVLRNVVGSATYDVVVAYTPSNTADAIRQWLGDAVTLRPQIDGGLGERMAAAVASAVGDGARRVAIIGTDCPTVTAHLVEEALDRLDDADVVLGPASDGGYYLIAMSRLHRVLFEDVPWSDPATLHVTIARARQAGLVVSLLPEQRDIDTVADWRWWMASTPS